MGSLLAEEKLARELVLGRVQYKVLDGVLYCIAADNTLRVVPPQEDRRKKPMQEHLVLT